MKQTALLLAMVVMMCGISQAETSVPPLINYQGMLTDSTGNPLQGTKKLSFKVYDAAVAGNLIWGPGTFASVPVVKGMFNVILGVADDGKSLISDAFGGKDRYLGVSIDGGAEVTPRQQILSAPFAVQADKVRGLEVDPAGNAKVNGEFTARASLGGQAFRAYTRSSDNFTWAPLLFTGDGANFVGGMAYSPAGISLTLGNQLTTLMNWAPGNTTANGQVGATGGFRFPDGTVRKKPFRSCTENDNCAGVDLLPPEGAWGGWSNWQFCPATHYVCGVQVKIEGSQGNGDDTAMNGIHLHCCPF